MESIISKFDNQSNSNENKYYKSDISKIVIKKTRFSKFNSMENNANNNLTDKIESENKNEVRYLDKKLFNNKEIYTEKPENKILIQEFDNFENKKKESLINNNFCIILENKNKNRMYNNILKDSKIINDNYSENQKNGKLKNKYHLNSQKEESKLFDYKITKRNNLKEKLKSNITKNNIQDHSNDNIYFEVYFRRIYFSDDNIIYNLILYDVTDLIQSKINILEDNKKKRENICKNCT